MSIWKDIIRVAAPIAGAVVGGPVGTILTGGLVSQMLPLDKRDQFEEWAKLAKELEANGGLTNPSRASLLRARIRRDLFQITGEEPKVRRVSWLVETVIMSVNGDFED